jgi:hypothetical protein
LPPHVGQYAADERDAIADVEDEMDESDIVKTPFLDRYTV